MDTVSTTTFVQKLTRVTGRSPALVDDSAARRGEAMDLVGEFLTRLGYGERIRESRLAASTPESFSRALSEFQRFYSLHPSGVLDEFTLRTIRHPRCGCRDLRPLRLARAGQQCIWGTESLTYSLVNSSRNLNAANAHGAVRAAFLTWQALGKISFVERPAGTAVDIEVRWTDAADNDFDLVGQTIAHGDFPGECAQVNPGLPKPVHFDDSEHGWAVGSVIGAFDVETIALHEIGHVLGLEHSPDPSSVMYPLFLERQIKQNLTPADVAEFRRLYP